MDNTFVTNVIDLTNVSDEEPPELLDFATQLLTPTWQQQATMWNDSEPLIPEAVHGVSLSITTPERRSNYFVEEYQMDTLSISSPDERSVSRGFATSRDTLNLLAVELFPPSSQSPDFLEAIWSTEEGLQELLLPTARKTETGGKRVKCPGKVTGLIWN